MRANFEFIEKLGVDKWCFHDRDIAPEGNTLKVSKLDVTYMMLTFHLMSICDILCWLQHVCVIVFI